ncbi:MAG: hypothetical protein CYPHOPRED_002323 [Cyphobasidiales sp. Tagirdzhanova-0007]|nr:MAG: hypothetical protein CYPHOPRED_002323 [Cyphobasidiales sp. Tagirdzhanova-0007]
MASIFVTWTSGAVSFASLVVSSDLLAHYGNTGYPSSQVKAAVIYALVTSIWGTLLALILPCTWRVGSTDSASPSLFFISFIAELVASILLGRAYAHGGAFAIKSDVTCHLFIAVLVLESIMTGLALLGMGVTPLYSADSYYMGEPAFVPTLV